MNVALSFEAHWCARHLEPYEPTWPAGAAVAMTMLFDATVRDERFARACGFDAITKEPGNAGMIPKLLAEFAPLCCFVGETAMAAIYAATGVQPPTSP